MNLQTFTYYTDAKYKAHAEALGKSARALGVAFESVEWADGGSWGENTRAKPLVILHALGKYVGSDVLFIDADAHLWSRPLEAIDGAHDIAGYYARYNTMYAGTLFFRNNSNARRLLHLWAQLLKDHPEYDDEEGLGIALQSLKAAIRVKRLPASYCWIDCEMRSLYPGMVPVIEHLTVGPIDERNRRAKLREERRKERDERPTDSTSR